MGKSAGSAPEAPNPYTVADAQKYLNRDTARIGATLNRPNISSPFGSQTWTPIPGSDQWSSSMSLGPQMDQAIGNLQGQAAQSSSQPFSLNSTMDTLSSVLEPQMQRDEDALITRLTNSGFRQGSQGYDQALQDFSVNKQKARAGTAIQAEQLASALREQPLNELNMIRGAGPQQQPGGQAQVAPTDITGPFNQQYQGQLAGYNANVGQQNSKLGAGTTLAAAYLLSDRRLKSNINRIGTHKLGIGIYEYDIGGRHEIGVMADEVEKVRPSAVREVNGFKQVNYANLA